MAHSVVKFLCITAIALPSLCHAWGAEGHRLTGLIAQSLLSPAARYQVNQLTPGGLADAANYMDVQRPRLAIKYPNSASWHYDDVPVCEHAEKPDYCAGGDCASTKISEFLKVLADFHSSKAQKQEALRLVVHMVGDIHQPLHAATNAGDRGGNLVHIMIRARSAKLHGAWDKDFVRDGLGNQPETSYAKSLITAYQDRFKSWRGGRAGDWITESHEIAKTVTYAKLPGFACNLDMTEEVIEVDDSYRAEAGQIVRERITAAGVRIAWLLNRAFGR